LPYGELDLHQVRPKAGANMTTDKARTAHVLLLTGAPGVGKTTVIRRAAERLAGRQLGGFYTEEIRVSGQRQGFRFVGFDGSERVLAHVDIRGGPRVSKYGVDLAAVDAVADTLLAPRPDVVVYLVDEIGKMECLSPHFVEAMRRLLDSGAIVIATVAIKGGGFIAEVKRRSAVVLWEVTHANRDSMPERVTTWLADRRG
jgi:nucleoside-triphosphatase